MSQPQIVTVDFSTENTRFDFLTMQTEWRDYMETQGGRSLMDGIDLVIALTKMHASYFAGALKVEGIKWNDLDGVFALSVAKLSKDNEFKIDREVIDSIWSSTWELVIDIWDEIDEAVNSGDTSGLF